MLQGEENKNNSSDSLEKFSDQAIREEFLRRFGELRKSGPKRGKGRRYHCQHCDKDFDATAYRKHSRRACKEAQRQKEQR